MHFQMMNHKSSLYCITQVAIEMFKVKHDISPPFMKEIFTYIGNERGTRSGDTFARPNIGSVYKGDQSLRSFGPIVWNTYAAR